VTDSKKSEEVATNCSTAGKGFARTENSDIVAEDCAMPDGPGKGYAKTDSGQNK
jgi:hypothetical protein